MVGPGPDWFSHDDALLEGTICLSDNSDDRYALTLPAMTTVAGALSRLSFVADAETTTRSVILESFSFDSSLDFLDSSFGFDFSGGSSA